MPSPWHRMILRSEYNFCRSVLGLSPEKGVEFSFLANGAVGTVARIYAQFIPQGKNLFHDSLDQLRVATAGKVSPPDGTGKKCVPGEHSARCMKADPSG